MRLANATSPIAMNKYSYKFPQNKNNQNQFEMKSNYVRQAAANEVGILNKQYSSIDGRSAGITNTEGSRERSEQALPVLETSISIQNSRLMQHQKSQNPYS